MKTFESVSSMKLATLKEGQFVETGGYYSKGDGGGARYLIATPQAADEFGDHTLANGNVAVLREEGSSPIFTQYGAKAGDNVFNSYPAINAAITKFLASAEYPIFDFRGDTFYGDTPLAYSSNFKMMNGIYEYIGSANNIAIIDVGDFNGDALTRGATVENMRARISTSSTNTGLVGIRLKGLVRSCSIRDCVAEMFGDVEGTKGHIGFEILANRIAASSAAGAYQNVIEGCTALFANTGFKLSTDGTQAEANGDPQANGNYLKKCFAYACRQKALDLSYGAQENECEVRADTFPTQTGLGTRIDVVNVDGRYNHVDLIEEIGPRADTQYTVRLGGSAIYNVVNASTQQVVSGFLDDSSSPQGKREKNVIKQLGSAILDAKDEDVFQFYGSVPASSSQSIQVVIPIRKKCVVTSCQISCTTAAGAAGDTRGYFAKNNSFSVVNRVILPASTAANTVVDKVIDTSASVDINDAWSYEAGDRIGIAFDVPANGPQTMGAVITVKYI